MKNNIVNSTRILAAIAMLCAASFSFSYMDNNKSSENKKTIAIEDRSEAGSSEIITVENTQGETRQSITEEINSINHSDISSSNNITEGQPDTTNLEENFSENRQLSQEYKIQKKRNKDYQDGNVSQENGLINIRRFGEGYEINFSLDTRETDVSFEMLLNPDDEVTTEEVYQTPIQNNNKLSSLAEDELIAAQKNFYRKNYSQALAQINKAIELEPKNANYYALQGSIFYKLSEFKRANSSWKSALSIDPSMSDVREQLQKLELLEAGVNIQ